MEHSYRYFVNKECEYYPCHKGVKDFNCLFCYCPLYHKKHCLGNYHYIKVNGKEIKSCENCTVPHKPENYDVIVQLLKGKE